MQEHEFLIEFREFRAEVNTRLENINRDISDLKNDNKRRLEAVEKGKLDKEEADRILADSIKIHDDHEKRLRSVESFQWKTVGASVILAVIGQALIQLALKTV